MIAAPYTSFVIADIYFDGTLVGDTKSSIGLIGGDGSDEGDSSRDIIYIFIRTGMPISCVLDVDRGVRHSYWPISFVHCALADN